MVRFGDHSSSAATPNTHAFAQTAPMRTRTKVAPGNGRDLRFEAGGYPHCCQKGTKSALSNGPVRISVPALLNRAIAADEKSVVPSGIVTFDDRELETVSWRWRVEIPFSYRPAHRRPRRAGQYRTDLAVARQIAPQIAVRTASRGRPCPNRNETRGVSRLWVSPRDAPDNFATACPW